MCLGLVTGVLNESGVNEQSVRGQRIPLVLAVALCRQLYVVVRGVSEEEPLSLGELVETAQVGAATASLVEVLKTPLAQHPVLVESSKAGTWLVKWSRAGEVTFANKVYPLCPCGFRTQLSCRQPQQDGTLLRRYP